MLKTLGILLVGLTLAGCSSSSGGGSGGSDADEGDGFGAEVMCEEFVKDQLKAPSTAKFSEQEHSETGDQRWDVTGSVDSQNGFGAMIRGSYRCDMKYLGDDQWKAKTVAGGLKRRVSLDVSMPPPAVVGGGILSVGRVGLEPTTQGL